ncbi:MAG: hypothetical protein WB685_16210 [Pseudolabrys sp.]
MTVSNNSLVINFNTRVGFNRETCNKDCEFLFGASISNDKVAFFQAFDRSDLCQSGYRARGRGHNQAARHGAKVVCFDQAVETASGFDA